MIAFAVLELMHTRGLETKVMATQLSSGQKKMIGGLLATIRRGLAPGQEPKDLRRQIGEMLLDGKGSDTIVTHFVPKPLKAGKPTQSISGQSSGRSRSLVDEAMDLGLDQDRARFSLMLGNRHGRNDKGATAFEQLGEMEQDHIRTRNAEDHIRAELKDDGCLCLMRGMSKCDGSTIKVTVSAYGSGCRQHHGDRVIEVKTWDVDGTVREI